MLVGFLADGVRMRELDTGLGDLPSKHQKHIVLPATDAVEHQLDRDKERNEGRPNPYILHSKKCL